MKNRIVLVITLMVTTLLLTSCQNKSNPPSSNYPSTTASGKMETEENKNLEDINTENEIDKVEELKKNIIGSWNVVSTTYTYKSNNEVFYSRQPANNIMFTFETNGILSGGDYNSVKYEVTEEGYIISYGEPLTNEKGQELTREEALENAIKRKISVSISGNEMIITPDCDDEDSYQLIQNDKGETATEPLYIKQICTRIE